MAIAEVSFKEFASIARKRGQTPESLAERFKGKIENPNEFFQRVMQERFAHVVISYRSVLEFYVDELHYFNDSSPGGRRCACGCNQPIFDRQKWASAACKKRTARQKVRDTQKGVSQVAEIIEHKPGQIGLVATNVSTRFASRDKGALDDRGVQTLRSVWR